MTEHDVPRRLARSLMYVGVTLATVGAAGWALGVLPSIPAWMVQIVVFKLIIGSGAGLVIAGAALKRSLPRHGTDEMPRHHVDETPRLPPDSR